MNVKIFRILGAVGFIAAMSSLSACLSGPYFPAHPGYAYGSPAYAYPQYVPKYVSTPRYFAYNPQPYWRYDQRWQHEEHEEHEHDWHWHDYGRDWHKHDHDDD